MEYILYCDESKQSGPKYGSFFGGCIVSGIDLLEVTSALETKKTELNLYSEVKWSKVTENYLNKYIDLIALFFSFIKSDKLKVRIMFSKNTDELPLPGISYVYTKYFTYYYRFIKNSFGLRYLKSDKPVNLKILIDELPDTRKNRAAFKKRLVDMTSMNDFSDSLIKVIDDDIAEVYSHNHVILQCLDIVLGSMYFRLNDLHLIIPEGQSVKGKRTSAKEKLLDIIIEHINEVMPNFNIYETTGNYNGEMPECYWNHAYRHWRYIPEQ